MEASRTSSSSQRLASTFETIIESPEADINTIPIVRSEQLITSSSRDIPVSVQELFHVGKAAGVGTSSQLLDRENELLPSIKDVFGPQKDKRSSEGVEPHVFQGKGPKDKSLVEKPKNFLTG
ncbi:hypothetical protein O181_079815 [Austropuccinia psidii MF-1]|uniref:Uncharacterized protein n=1 Tax=Austropuccinia psidii MF-1 TaxID=1389203 RepID=A0A9Q3IIB0_9BASI|nr:hypothetical protein [Austropuccinia psidii MF-1]